MFQTSIVPPTDGVLTTGEIKRQHRRSIIREFCLTTSIHGLPGIARSESIRSRIFRLISFTGSASIMIYFIIKASIAYFDYPTNLDLSYVTKWPQYFPAFSLCNIAPLRYDLFIGPFLNYSNRTMEANANDTVNTNAFSITELWNFLIHTNNMNGSVESFFFSLSSMLYTCTYNFQICSAQDFIPFLSSSYGLCFTFNPKLKNSSNNNIRYTNQNGGSGKLYLGLYVHSHQYIPHTMTCKRE